MNEIATDRGPRPLPCPRPCGDAPHGASPPAAALDVIAGAATALSRWYLTPPPAEVLARLQDPGLLGTWPVRPSRAGDPTSRGLAALRRVHDHAAVCADHAILFVGPERVAAAPYESVYTSRDGLLFEPETLDVRAWYRHYGLRAPRQGQEPDDHIGLELEFIATLAVFALDAVDAGDERGAAAYADGLRGFCDAHLLRWCSMFTDRLSRRAATDFYRGVADLTRGLAEEIPQLLGEP